MISPQGEKEVAVKEAFQKRAWLEFDLLDLWIKIESVDI